MALNNRESGYLFAKRKSRENRNRLVAILGCMVVLAAAIALMMPALSMTHGDAVCGVEEHVHADACYERVLVCGLNESDGHEHGDACYETKLTCEKPEHEHSSACFVGGAGEGGEADGANGAAEATAGADADAVNGDAGKAEAAGDVEGNASQGASSAASSASAASADAADGDSASQGDSANSEGKDGAATAKLNTQSANMPAQEFKLDLKDENDDVVLTVAVKAPKGAFPENTHMKIDGVPMEDVQEQVEATLKDAGLDSPELKQAQAVDIAFFSEDGDVIQPAKAVAVKIAAQSLQDVESPVLMRVLESDQVVKLVDGTVTDRHGEPFANAADKYVGAKVVKKVERLEADAKDAEGGMVTLAFKADEFSPFTLLELDEESADQVAAALADEGEGEEASDSSDGDGDGEDGSAKSEGAASAGKVIKSEVAMPAQKFSENVKGEDGKTALSVAVEAPEGALPDGASMVVQLVKDNDVTTVAKEKAEGESAVSGTHAQVVAADITFLDAEGNAVEPAKDVRVTMGAPVVASSNEVAVVHVDDKLDAEVVKVSEVDQKNETVAFDAASFSVYAIVYTVGSEFSANGELYEVTVTYGEDAKIPEGSTLKVTEFAEGTKDYEYARKTVVADKQAKGESVDFSGLAALDISILDAEGNKIEPAAPVQVDMKIKALPGVANVNEVASTLAVEHHVETDDGVVVETVYDGNTEASFRMETNEAVAAAGTAVDPNTADMSQFCASTFDLYSDGSIVASEPEVRGGEIDVSFPTPVFSTFTVTWNSGQATSNQLRVHSLSNGKYILYAKDAANGNYYALVPSTTLNSVQVTVGGDTVQYSGSENLYWDVEVSGNTYYFSFFENGTKYYLAAGTIGDHVQAGTSKTAYGDASTTSWGQWSDYIHSAQHTFLQSNNGVFKTWYVLGHNDWGNQTLIYFEKEGAASGPHATIHYVDEDGNELTVSKGSISSSTLLNNNAYLIYDIEGGGYEYKETYLRRGSSDTAIRAYLNWNGSNWRYRDSNGWASVNNSDDIYVVYKKKKVPTKGGTPTLVELDDDEKPEAPTVTKESKVNHDGTNTLSLSVTSHTKPREVLKLADVVVIFDRSGSMGEEIGSDNNTSDASKQRMALLKKAVNNLAGDLIGDDSDYIYTDSAGVKHKQIEMSLVSFSNDATDATAFTDSLSTFKGWVNGLSPDGGTNWEQALQKANEASVDPGRATFVIFVTDGEPTFRMSRMTDTDNSLYDDMYINGPSYYYSNNVYGTGNSDNQKDGFDYGRNYRAALEQAKSIVGSNKNLYMIGIGPEIANLEQFNADAGADGYYSATSSDSLTQAFEDIKKHIAAMAGYGDFQISDGITALTQTVQKSELVSFADDDFTYYKGKVDHAATQADVDAGRAKNVGDPVVLTWSDWDPDSENCATAKYENGAVVWNMGSSFMPQEGYTYQVRFKVWPSQEAYDLLADLNNSADPAAAYAALDRSVKDQIAEPETPGGVYTLKTNSKTSYNYKDATIVDGTVSTSGENLLNPAGEFDNVDPLELTTKPLKVKKQWHKNYSASREPVDHIAMELYGVDSDGTTSHDFKTFTLTSADNWYAENNYVSYGLVTYDAKTNSGEKVYETGHDFTLREIDDEAHYFELTAGVYRPMYINGTPTILERVDAVPEGMDDDVFHYGDGTHHYYRLDGKIYRDTQSDTLLIATNTRRSYMDLNKVVVDESGKSVVDDTEFEYNVTFTVPSGIANYDTLEKYIWFSVYDTVAGRTLAPSEYDHTGTITPYEENHAFTGPEYANYLVATSGQPITLKIKQGWNVRFLNLPIGTTYSFEETNIPEDYNFVKAEVSGTRWIANMVDGVDQGSAQTMTSLPSNTSGNNNSTSIGGKIDFANACYNTTYTNKTLAQHVKIKKTSQDGTTLLPGAVFSLYTESGYSANPKSAFKTNLTSDGNGAIDLGELAHGKYYLEEMSAPEGYILLAKPVEITVAASGVTYKQDDYSQSMSGGGVAFDEVTKVYTLTVTNNAGYELPSTGGPGAEVFTVLGSILVLGAGALLWRRRLA